VWVALGGSATVDGGAGAAAALGFQLLDAAGEPIACGGGALERLARIVPPAAGPWRDRGAGRVRVVALCDVENPLLGERGAARVFGPQKGAAPAAVERLERGLAHLAAAIERDLGVDVRPLRGGGAAGGAGAGAAAFLGARLGAGARVVLRLQRFDRRLRRAQLVVTGEGRLDAQSFDGKVVSAVTRAAAARGVPVAVVAGRSAIDDALAREHGLVAVEAAASAETGDAEASARAEPLLEAAAERLGRRLIPRRSGVTLDGT
jgi:glycerate kinase